MHDAWPGFEAGRGEGTPLWRTWAMSRPWRALRYGTGRARPRRSDRPAKPAARLDLAGSIAGAAVAPAAAFARHRAVIGRPAWRAPRRWGRRRRRRGK